MSLLRHNLSVWFTKKFGKDYQNPDIPKADRWLIKDINQTKNPDGSLKREFFFAVKGQKGQSTELEDWLKQKDIRIINLKGRMNIDSSFLVAAELNHIRELGQQPFVQELRGGIPFYLFRQRPIRLPF